MLKKTLATLALLSLVSLSGCFHQQVIVDSGYDAAKTTPDFQKTHIHILGAINLENQAALDEICPNGAGMVENKTLFRSDAVVLPPLIFLSGFPIGPVIAVEQYSVYCKS